MSPFYSPSSFRRLCLYLNGYDLIKCLHYPCVRHSRLEINSVKYLTYLNSTPYKADLSVINFQIRIHFYFATFLKPFGRTYHHAGIPCHDPWVKKLWSNPGANGLLCRSKRWEHILIRIYTLNDCHKGGSGQAMNKWINHVSISISCNWISSSAFISLLTFR